MSLPRKKTILAVCVMLAIGAAATFFFWPRAPLPDLDQEPIDQAKDERFRELAIGTWEDDYQGKRTLTIRPDGTATMLVELSGLNAILGSKMTFYEVWSIKRGHFQMKATGGEPKGRVNMILKTMGDETIQKILELSDTRMLLLDPDGKTEYDWHRKDNEAIQAKTN